VLTVKIEQRNQLFNNKGVTMSIQVVSFNCVLKSKTGQFISSTYNREVLTAQQAEGALLNGLALGLQNLVAGEKRQVSLTAQQAYGFYDPQKVIFFPRNKLPKHTRVGESIQIAGKSGQIRTYKVLQLHDNMITLDANHPLAGQDLIFEIDVISAREALPEEITESANPIAVQLLH
jgi:FKBP-type peptidyl-prolyl cis-trans isomerase SlyD